MITGFQLRTLRVTGKGKQPAEVIFRPGLNVISGASNTGKSYILQCISFMLGSSKRPKRLDESNGYESCVLELEAQDGQVHQLERSLSGNAFIHRLISGDAVTSEQTLSERNDPTDRHTVSGLLLDLSHAWGMRIRQSQAGRTRQVSFADLRRLTLIDEVRIISESSPVLSGQYTTATEETSFFKLLLTGVDDSSVVASETRQENNAKRSAQLELLDRLIPNLERDIADLDDEVATIGDRMKRVTETIAHHSDIVERNQQEIAEQEEKQRDAWNKAKSIEQQQTTTAELRRRFKLLEEHYNNDMERLLAVIEVDSFFEQLQQVRCPLCGANTDQHDPSVHGGQADNILSEIQSACRAEIAKIKVLLRDLVGTTSQLDVELSNLQAAYSDQRSLFDATTQDLTNRLAPAAKRSQGELENALQVRDRLAQATVLQERHTGLIAERNQIAASTWKCLPKTANSDILLPQSIESLTLKVQTLLQAWRYPGLTRVTFSDERLDLIISGKDRGSEGKGFRAIAYAAFMIGLLDYCADSQTQLPHSGLVVLDSPLVTYKRRDTEPGEEIPEDVTVAFYTDLAALPANKQVIVLENNDPPADLQSRLNYTHFSRSSSGRYGFFPKP